MNQIPISSIKIGNRFRKDMGDIESLAISISEHGLLQPIGIDEDRNLVFGARRIEAHIALARVMIPYQTIYTKSQIQVEEAENKDRKDFSPSEKVAIADAIRERIGNRQGQRTDREELLDETQEVPQGTSTIKHAASEAGFGSDRTYRDAKKVVESGNQEIIDKMDSGEITINKAAIEVKPEQPKKVPIDLNIETENKTIDDYFELVESLEASVRRCCNSCDEPIQLIEMMKNNAWFGTMHKPIREFITGD